MTAKKIVTIGGGSGQFVLLQSLKKFLESGQAIDISAIVSMSDSGGSSGRLRDQYGELPPGDVLKCLLALSSYKEARDIFHYRFDSDNNLNGHNAGNLLLLMLSQHLGRNFPTAIKSFGELLKIRGQVLPVTIDKTTLVAELEDGRRIYGESAIDKARSNVAIKEVYLVPHQSRLEIYPEVAKAISVADYVIIGPGDFYTSIIPNLLVPGIHELVKNSTAKFLYILNIMTKHGETDNYSAIKFVERLEHYLGRSIDMVVANNGQLAENILLKYSLEKAEPVKLDFLADIEKPKLFLADLVTTGEIVRHDIDKLNRVLSEIISQ